MVSKRLLAGLSTCLAALGYTCHAQPTSGDVIDALQRAGSSGITVAQSGPPLLRRTTRLNAGASVEDIVSNTGSCMYMGSTEKTVTGLILGNELHIRRLQDSSPTSAEDAKKWRSWCAEVTKKIWSRFREQSEDVGQATVTLVVNADGSWEILTKTIYVPDNEPFSGSQPLSKIAENFWLQVHSALGTIDEATPPTTPGVESIKFEMVLGRDQESFPRHAACGQLNLVHRNPKGGISVGKVVTKGMNVHESSN